MFDIYKPIMKMVWNSIDKVDKKRIASQTFPDTLTTHCNIAYINDLNKYHLLDVYYPENINGDLPVIIDVHGGGWWYGTKEINKNYCLHLALKGFVVVNINYRLVDSVMLIDQLNDIFQAFKWVGENIEKYHGDLNNVFLTGDSAGGQFACLCAQINADSDLRKKLCLPENKFDFRAVGATSPVIDLTMKNPMLGASLNSLLGTVNHKKSRYYFLMNFSNIASASLPPFYIVTSKGDFVEKQGAGLHKLLDELGVENRFRDFTEKYNGKYLPHVFSIIDPDSKPAAKVINEMTAFFKNHIKD